MVRIVYYRNRYVRVWTGCVILYRDDCNSRLLDSDDLPGIDDDYRSPDFENSKFNQIQKMKTLENISCWTWELLQTIIGLFVIWIYKAEYFKDKGNRKIYLSKTMPGGISLGRYIILNTRYTSDIKTHNHEYGHTRQSLYLGPLYLFVIGIPSILNAAFDFTSYYYDFYTEKWADKLGGVKRVKSNKY